jgi:hypothetical protein
MGRIWLNALIGFMVGLAGGYRRRGVATSISGRDVEVAAQDCRADQLGRELDNAGRVTPGTASRTQCRAAKAVCL